MENKRFRNSVFGGFNRDDVLHYIEEASRTCRERSDADQYKRGYYNDCLFHRSLHAPPGGGAAPTYGRRSSPQAESAKGPQPGDGPLAFQAGRPPHLFSKSPVQVTKWPVKRRRFDL